MPSINLKKELYDNLIRKNIHVVNFVNDAVKEKLDQTEEKENE